MKGTTWVKWPAKASKPRASAEVKAQVQNRADELIESVLKPVPECIMVFFELKFAKMWSTPVPIDSTFPACGTTRNGSNFIGTCPSTTAWRPSERNRIFCQDAVRPAGRVLRM